MRAEAVIAQQAPRNRSTRTDRKATTMAPRVEYVLFKARYGWVAVVGLLIAAALFSNGALVAGAIAFLVTVIASVGTYAKVDRPIVNQLPTSG